MPDDNRGKLRRLMTHGVGIMSGAAGGALGALAGDPATAAFMGAAGYGVGQVLETVGGEMYDRLLSRREEMRVGAACGFAVAAIQERLDRGEQPRNDGFFTPDATNRSAAEELFEGVLLKCKNEHEESKLRFVSNVYANAAFSNVSGADANAVLSIANNLSYRQMCILAIFGGSRSEFMENDSQIPGFGETVNKLNRYGGVGLAYDYIFLVENLRLIVDNRLTSLGEMCFELLGLSSLAREEINRVTDKFILALNTPVPLPA